MSRQQEIQIYFWGPLVFLVVISILASVWTKMIGWHFTIKQHRRVPGILFAVTLLVSGGMFIAGMKADSLAMAIVSVVLLLFLKSIVGAGCPVCGQRLRVKVIGQVPEALVDTVFHVVFGRQDHEHHTDRPVEYSCRNCSFVWRSDGETNEKRHIDKRKKGKRRNGKRRKKNHR
jgi:hypothetical protein